MDKIEITVGKKFIQKYRQYKIDLINGGDIDMEYEIFSHTVENSPVRMSDVYDAISDENFESATISTSNGLTKNTDYINDVGGFDDFSFDLE